MTATVLTLTTDFGDTSPYAAALKGAILAVNPAARLLDLTHRIPPQDVRHAAHFLAAAVPSFPAGTIHVVVVDPGVGTERALLHVEAAGQRLLAPDNGCLGRLLTVLGGEPVVRRLAEPRFWRPAVSPTFHGRDILGPVAGHLSRGLDPAELGPRVEAITELELPAPRILGNGLAGEVSFVDDFGNLITNIPMGLVRQPPDVLQVGKPARRRFRWVRTYAEAAPGTVVVLGSSDGFLKVAVVAGSAARRLKARVGMPIVIGWTR